MFLDTFGIQKYGGGGSIPPLPGGWAFPHNMIDVSVVLESLIDWGHY